MALLVDDYIEKMLCLDGVVDGDVQFVRIHQMDSPKGEDSPKMIVGGGQSENDCWTVGNLEKYFMFAYLWSFLLKNRCISFV